MFARCAIAGAILIAGLCVGLATIGAHNIVVLAAIAPKALFWVAALALLAALIGWEVLNRAERRRRGSEDEIANGADLLVRLLDDALAAADRKPLQQIEPIDLTALLTHAAKRHGRTDLEGRPSAVYTLGERCALEQVFDILIANALSSGSRAVLRIDHGMTFAAIHVDDDGPGVPRAERAKVFERRTYRRLDQSDKTSEREACVTARQIARAHGGDILISCSSEGGARFTVHLPLHNGAETARMAAALGTAL